MSKCNQEKKKFLKYLKLGLKYQINELKKCTQIKDSIKKKKCIKNVPKEYIKTKIEKDAKKSYQTLQKCVKSKMSKMSKMSKK